MGRLSSREQARRLVGVAWVAGRFRFPLEDWVGVFRILVGEKLPPLHPGELVGVRFQRRP